MLREQPSGVPIPPPPTNILNELGFRLERELAFMLAAGKHLAVSANPAAMALCYRRHPKDEMEGHVTLYHWVAAALARGKAAIPEGTYCAIQRHSSDMASARPA